jgi:hypothetical protein
MFERSKSEAVDTSGVSVVLTLTDGTELKGRLAVPAGRSMTDILNGTIQFLEFEEYAGARTFLAKHAIAHIRLASPPRGQGLARMRDADNFDPYAILGLPLGARFEDVRAAYLAKTKTYHPDRYASAELPDEVKRYLEDMARRINAAFSALEEPHQQNRQNPVHRLATVTPVYSSPAR